uniref:Methyltransferase domain-containing protein n=1 Tax=viral metagenome TaxID=1070528 RepID=A0A6C0LYB7_9ZZZZ
MEETARSRTLRLALDGINTKDYTAAFDLLCTMRFGAPNEWEEESHVIYSKLLRVVNVGRIDVSMEWLVSLINEYGEHMYANQVYYEIGILFMTSRFKRVDLAFYYFCKCIVSTDVKYRGVKGGGFHFTASMISDMISPGGRGVKLCGSYDVIYEALVILLEDLRSQNTFGIDSDAIAAYAPMFILNNANHPFVVEFDSYFYDSNKPTINYELAAKSIPSLLCRSLSKVSFRRPVRMELFLLAIRNYVLRNYSTIGMDDITPFLMCMACQEYINGGLHPPNKEELAILQSLNSRLMFESYGIYGVGTNDTNDVNRDLHRMMVVEPAIEKEYIKIIETDEIQDATSRMVANQYDEDPYPKWLGFHTFVHSDAIKFYAANDVPYIPSTSANLTHPNILVAGCGTGKDPLSLCHAFGNECHIDAIDISIRALSYAYRRTKEYGLLNTIDYRQKDLLTLSCINKYDIIRSCGVIHHTKDPELSLRKLVNALKPGGLLCLGVYSQRSRDRLHEIATRYNIDRTDRSRSNIVASHNLLIEKANTNGDLEILVFGDVHNYSMFRDLMFHVQERGYPLEWFKYVETEYGLTFLNMQNRTSSTKTLDEWIAIETTPSEWERHLGWGLYTAWFIKR